MVQLINYSIRSHKAKSTTKCYAGDKKRQQEQRLWQFKWQMWIYPTAPTIVKQQPQLPFVMATEPAHQPDSSAHCRSNGFWKFSYFRLLFKYCLHNVHIWTNITFTSPTLCIVLIEVGGITCSLLLSVRVHC